MIVHDAHCHFLTKRFFEALGRDKYGDKFVSAEATAGEIGWEVTDNAGELARRWVAELDEHRLSRAALIASVPGDEDSVAAAVERYPDRFVGFFSVDASAGDAEDRVERAFAGRLLRCACLFAAMHGYSYQDHCVYKVFEAAARHGCAVFAHCGYLSIEARVKLGVPRWFNLRLGDPLMLAATAGHFPTVPVIIPHFGAGFLREAFMAAEMCPTIHLDTSSSNAWLRYFPELTLAEVFRRALLLVGPDRLLFGTDSSSFPRGWRRVIHGAQRTALDEIGVELEVKEKIFSKNFERLFKA
jgi:uncharacterized protein